MKEFDFFLITLNWAFFGLEFLREMKICTEIAVLGLLNVKLIKFNKA